MKNVYILPTKKPSRLHLAYAKDYYISVEPFIQLDTKNYKSFSLCITSNEKIKKEDWFYDLDGELCKYTSDYKVDPNNWDDNKKVILTTDQDLIDDGIQPIDDIFLEWFIANSGCEEVEIDYQTIGLKDGVWQYDYKIIIPEEELKQTVQEYEQQGLEKYSNELVEPKQDFNPTQGEEVWIKVFSNWSKGTYIGYDITKKIHLVREDEEGGGHLLSSSEILPYYSMPNIPKQETLEEAAKKLFKEYSNNISLAEGHYEYMMDKDDFKEAFLEIAKWMQERMYSEEEVFNICRGFATFVMRTEPSNKKQQEWFEQFKKK